MTSLLSGKCLIFLFSESRGAGKGEFAAEGRERGDERKDPERLQEHRSVLTPQEPVGRSVSQSISLSIRLVSPVSQSVSLSVRLV